MTKFIIIHDCRKCPHHRYGNVCYTENQRIYLIADELFPHWCPLDDYEGGFNE